MNKHMQRYDLVTWPESQDFIGRKDCFLVDPESEKDPDDSNWLDSSYMVPSDDGEYAMLEFPESQNWLDAPGTLYDYESRLFVPVFQMLR